MKRTYLAAAALLLTVSVTASVFGQAGTGFTISDGNVFFTQVNSPTAGTVGSVSGANLRVSGVASTDHLFENWWWYRVVGANSRELAFNTATGTVVAGDTATTTWVFPEGFTAVLTYDANSTGATSGDVIETMVLTNTSPAAMELNIYNYADFDVNGVTSNTAVGANANPNFDEMDLATNPAGFATAEFDGVLSTNYQVTAFATLRGLLTNSVINDLNNTGLPFGPGDFSGAYQWLLTLQPGQPFTIRERLAARVPEPGSLALLGLGALALIRRR